MIDSIKFKELVKEKGLSHDEVREMAGLSEKVYSWILENEFIEKRTLQRFAKIIDCDMNMIFKPDPGEKGENTIEFRKGEETALLTLCYQRYISRVKKISQKYPKECKILAVNKDGSILAEIPTDWIKINPKRVLTDEQRKTLADRLKK